MLNLVGKRFAHQRFADSRESIRANRFVKKKKKKFEALGQIRANRVFSPIRIEIRVLRVQSSLLSPFLEGRFARKRFFESIRANRPTNMLNPSTLKLHTRNRQ